MINCRYHQDHPLIVALADGDCDRLKSMQGGSEREKLFAISVKNCFLTFYLYFPLLSLWECNFWLRVICILIQKLHSRFWSSISLIIIDWLRIYRIIEGLWDSREFFEGSQGFVGEGDFPGIPKVLWGIKWMPFNSWGFIFLFKTLKGSHLCWYCP